MPSLDDLDSFGGVAAEDEPVLDYFLQTDAVRKSKVTNRCLRRRSGVHFPYATTARIELTVTLQADSHLDANTDPAVYAQALRNALSDGPDFHIDLGDTSMTDKYDAYKDSLKQYLAQRFYFGLICHSVPLFFTIGNHDGEEERFLNGAADNIAAWSNAMRKLYLPTPVPDGFYTGNDVQDPVAGMVEDYYAWEWGDALFVVLDPFWYTRPQGKGGANGWDWTLGEHQYQWLKPTLESSRAKFKLIFIHHLVGGGDSS
jgi:hypothetical protein